jgi:hypothetical protein
MIAQLYGNDVSAYEDHQKRSGRRAHEAELAEKDYEKTPWPLPYRRRNQRVYGNRTGQFAE